MAVLLHGAGASPGLAWGRVQIWCPPVVSAPMPAAAVPLRRDEVPAELARYQEAVRVVQEQLGELQRLTDRQADAEVGAILAAQAMMAADPELAAEVTARLESGTHLAEAVKSAGEEFAEVFAALEDPYLRQRAADVQDVTERIVAVLTGSQVELPGSAEETVLVMPEVPPSVVARLDPVRIKAVVTAGGGPTSHAALLAKGLGIPAVMGCPEALTALVTGDQVAVDGGAGQVLARLAPAEEAAFRLRIAAEEDQKRQLAALADLPTVTAGGRRIQLGANVTRAREVRAAAAAGVDGVGLFRTEFLFLDRDSLPDEEEQFAEYRTVLAAMAPRPVVIRTLDIGGDKPVPALALPHEENPFLGWRGVRLWLDREDLAIPQIRALLRAAKYGDLSVMLPMVSNLSEVQAARALFERVRSELGSAAGPYKLGIMVEVPAAALDADRLAAEVDFFSIGTNDLVQYTMAADRGNTKVAALYDPLHPAVLKLIELTVRAAHARSIWVGVCGDAARDPAVLPKLVALGVDELSVPPAAAGMVKRQVRALP